MQGADTIGFEIATCGKPSSQKLDYRALSSRDQAPMFVHLSQLKGRSLSVAAGRFAEQIRKSYAQPWHRPHHTRPSKESVWIVLSLGWTGLDWVGLWPLAFCYSVFNKAITVFLLSLFSHRKANAWRSWCCDMDAAHSAHISSSRSKIGSRTRTSRVSPDPSIGGERCNTPVGVCCGHNAPRNRIGAPVGTV